MLRVTPIYGSDGHHPSSTSLSLPPICTLIEYGGVRVLVDVGWDESVQSDYDNQHSSSSAMNRIRNRMADLPPADVILVTDSTLSSIGGLPLFMGSDANKQHSSSTNESSSSSSTGTPNSKQQHSTRKCSNGAGLFSKNPPIFGTFPTLKLGQMTLYDHHANTCLDGRNPSLTSPLHWDLDDVDTLFSPTKFQTLKYSQTKTISAADQDNDDANNNQNKQQHNKSSLSITPHRSGHVVGGSFWVLKRTQDETTVVVAMCYNHAREKHLDACQLSEYASAADVLITRPGGPGGLLSKLYSPFTNRQIWGNNSSGSNNNIRKLTKNKKRLQSQAQAVLQPQPWSRLEQELVDFVMSALRRGGNVLLPVDASGRVLELLLLLSTHWSRHRLNTTYKLCWVGSMCSNIAEYVRAQLEWMAEPLGRQFDSHGGHPYALRNIKMCSSVGELEEVEGLGLPMVVLASGGSLDCGPARDLLVRWADNPDNAVVITDSQRCVPRGKSYSKSSKGGGGVLRRSASDLSAGGKAADGDATAAAEETHGSSSLVGRALSLSETSSYSTAAQLLLKWCEAKASDEEMADVVTVDVLVPSRAPLSGVELAHFRAQEEEARLEKRKREERKAMLREVELARGRLRLGEDDLAEDIATSTATTTDTKAPSSSKTMSQPPSKKSKKSRFDSNLFLKFSKPMHLTFDVTESAVGIGQSDSRAKYGVGESVGYTASEILQDDYGIAVLPNRFHDVVTGIDPSKYSSAGGGSGRIGDDVLKRGLGFGSDGRPVLGLGGVPPNTAFGSAAGGNVKKEDGFMLDGIMDGTAAPGTAGELSEEMEQAMEASDLSEGNGIIRGRSGRPPIKVSTVARSLEVLAEIAYIPLEGRVHARAARQSVRALQPRQVVILGGGTPASVGLSNQIDKPPVVSEDEGDTNIQQQPNKLIVGEAALLADAVRELTIRRGDNSIFAPSNGESVELSVGHAAYSARLIDTPYMAPAEKEALLLSGGEMPIPEPLDATEVELGNYMVSLVDCIATGQTVAADGSVVLAPRPNIDIISDTTAILSQQNNDDDANKMDITTTTTKKKKKQNVMLSDGEVLLTDLRSEFVAQGHKAEYSTHSGGYQQLIINGKIVIRKEQGTGRITVDGPLCEDFFTVRRIVCSQYITL